MPMGTILCNDELCLTLRSLEWTLQDDAKTLFWFPLQGEELERWQKLKFDVEKIFSNKIPQNALNGVQKKVWIMFIKYSTNIRKIQEK